MMHLYPFSESGAETVFEHVLILVVMDDALVLGKSSPFWMVYFCINHCCYV